MAAVDEILPVSDDTRLAALLLLAERAGALAEPSGRRQHCGLMEHRGRLQGSVVVSVIMAATSTPNCCRA